ncbi:MAG TPA: ABC transporter ATP-binding protein [Caldilineaceae bacterium]|nr:ABC transporter ATP-binding protein [Caldilineaceae bacterium]
MAQIAYKNINKRFGSVVALNDLNLTIADREFVTLVGPSGCGKSTTLNITAGLEDPSGGELYIDERLVNAVPPGERDIAMVFQSYALYPHKTVRENIGFGLKVRKMEKAEIERRVQEAAQLLGIANLLDRKPRELSGGQRQRVALGRAITRNPKVFLLDEPLSNLDAKLRVQMRAELKLLFDRIQGTVLYVTHDQAEAMTLSDRVVVMQHGVVQQVGTPLDVYNLPNNEFVAGFMGSPAMNFLSCELQQSEAQLTVGMGGQSWAMPLGGASGTTTPTRILNNRDRLHGTLTMGIRPEDLTLTTAEAPDEGVPCRIMLVEHMGATNLFYVDLQGQRLVVTTDADFYLPPATNAVLHFNPAKVHFFATEGGRNLTLY